MGERIPEEAIESYFVWIPKYRYKLFNVEGDNIPEQEIDIKIGDYDTVDNNTAECKATNKSGDSGTCKTGMWMTHPAFTSLGVNGIWVGKFETGYKGSTDKASAQINETASNKVQIKPNVNSWRNINVSNIYNTSFNYKRSLDSHMMKNTEWGAMVYLTNSKYGRGNSEVWINNNYNFMTGCVASSASAPGVSDCTNAYVSSATNDEQRKNNAHGSTTDNISGIYDTSGGAWDYVMGNYNNTIASSEIDFSSINMKYYDKYTGENVDYKILGDATGETQHWNQDYASFASSRTPWFLRGGYYDHTAVAGVFSFGYDVGYALSDRSFRIVLSPTNQ